MVLELVFVWKRGFGFQILKCYKWIFSNSISLLRDYSHMADGIDGEIHAHLWAREHIKAGTLNINKGSTYEIYDIVTFVWDSSKILIPMLSSRMINFLLSLTTSLIMSPPMHHPCAACNFPHVSKLIMSIFRKNQTSKITFKCKCVSSSSFERYNILWKAPSC